MSFERKILCPITGKMMNVSITLLPEFGKVEDVAFGCNYSSGDPRCRECHEKNIMNFLTQGQSSPV